MTDLKRIAVFIDAENIAANHADALFAEIAKRGEISFCRAYGDFTAERMKAWESKIKAHNISSFQQDSISNYKNAADIALVIGAMDILHWKRAERFFIVSNDGDFTPLAKRIMAFGHEVIGFGSGNPSKAFVSECDDYVSLLSINKARIHVEPERQKLDASSELKVETQPVLLVMPPEIRKKIRVIVNELILKGGEINRAIVFAEMKKEDPEFVLRDYGPLSIGQHIINLVDLARMKRELIEEGLMRGSHENHI